MTMMDFIYVFVHSITSMMEMEYFIQAEVRFISNVSFPRWGIMKENKNNEINFMAGLSTYSQIVIQPNLLTHFVQSDKKQKENVVKRD